MRNKMKLETGFTDNYFGATIKFRKKTFPNPEKHIFTV